jgi:hypothetical protein
MFLQEIDEPEFGGGPNIGSETLPNDLARHSDSCEIAPAADILRQVWHLEQ